MFSDEPIDETAVSTQQSTLLGQLTMDLMHEIINPLTAATWSLESVLEDHKNGKNELAQVKKKIALSLKCLHRIEEVVKNARHQYQPRLEKVEFSVTEELKAIEEVFKLKLNQTQVKLSLTCPKKVSLFGSPLRFTQAISDLLMDILNIYGEPTTIEEKKNRNVAITVKKDDQHVYVTIQDGSPRQKTGQQGENDFLNIAKKIVESDFEGSIEVKLNHPHDTVFELTLPILETPKK